jgi:hypothetical protein
MRRVCTENTFGINRHLNEWILGCYGRIGGGKGGRMCVGESENG